jgi:hypothetical protein
MDYENVVYVHNRVLFIHKEECNYVIYRKMVELELIMVSEVSQIQKDKGHMLFLMWKINPKDNVYTNMNMIIYIHI